MTSPESADFDPAEPKPALVSIIMPVFNAQNYLEQAIQSVRQQNYPHWEMWIVDDGSTDASPRIAQACARSDARIQWLTNQQAKGPAGARNTGIQLAQGHYIAFLDADDYWLPDKLAIQIPRMQEASAALSATAYTVVDHTGKPLKRIGLPSRITYRDLLRGNPVGCLTAVYDQTLVGKAYMPTDFHHEDYLTWLTIVREHGPALGIEQPLACYRRHAGSLSATKSQAARWQWRIYRQALGFSWWQAAYLFSQYAWRGWVKHHN